MATSNGILLGLGKKGSLKSYEVFDLGGIKNSEMFDFGIIKNFEALALRNRMAAPNQVPESRLNYPRH